MCARATGGTETPLRSRLVIPAALLVTVAYVKGRLDSNLQRRGESRDAVRVATPPLDPILRAQAEAEDAMVIAESQAAAAGVAFDAPAAPDPAYLSEWLTTPTWGPVPRRARARDAFDPARLAEWAINPAPEPPRPRARPGFDPGRMAEWMTDPAPRTPRRTPSGFDPAALAEWVTNPTWGPLRRTRAREVLDAAALVEWASDPTWGEIRRARTRDAFEAAALAEWVTHVAPAAVDGDAAPRPEAEAEPVAVVAGAGAQDPVAEPEHDSQPELPPEPELLVKPEAGPEVEVRIDETGRFSLGGWAAQPGHMVLCGVTFRDRRDRPVDPAAIRLSTDAASNVGDGGLVVLSDAGFAPDREGFTLLLAAQAAGSFAAVGRYEVIAD